MPTRPGRRFTVMDSMVLVAATAIGLTLTYGGWEWDFWQSNCDARSLLSSQKPLTFSDKVSICAEEAEEWVFEHGVPMLVSWTAAVLALRLRSPRPKLRRLARQPGFCAVLVPILVIAARSL